MKAPSELPLCDIVMEGGITSGIIYPHAVVKLSKNFRIKNIGGTSAGAIAAAATAAAELGRAYDPEGDPGFKRLANLPTELASPYAGSTRMLQLFQPSPATQPLFTLLIAGLNAKTALERGLRLLHGAMLAYCERFYLAAALPLIPTALFSRHDVYAWIVSALLGVLFGMAALLYSFWRVLTGPVVDQGFGICRGYEKGDETRFTATGDDDKAPLTLWLSRLLNQCAGKPADGPPLTFGELWYGDSDSKRKPRTDLGPPAWLQTKHPELWKYINLEMMTTSVTHSRPYRFPFADDDQQLFFDPVQLEAWFPPNVIEHMRKNAPAYAPTSDSLPRTLPENLLVLPAAKDLPVVFATRLSLSFPLLLCAVPLWAIDFENRKHSARRFEPCWFSDGGISSNFPIHLFDAPLPRWPTFGLKLESELAPYLPIRPLAGLDPREAEEHAWDAASHSTTETNRFFFPPTNAAGRGDSWTRIDSAALSGADKLIAFAAGLFSATRNWHDRMLTRAPGVRDRVVRLYLKDGEGGLNLNMEPALVTRLAELGDQAADRLIARYAGPPTTAMGMDNHRWVRLRNLAAVIERDFGELHCVISDGPPERNPWTALIEAHVGLPPWPELHAIDAQQSDKLQKILNDLRQLSLDASTGPKVTDGPKRAPVARIVPNV